MRYAYASGRQSRTEAFRPTAGFLVRCGPYRTPCQIRSQWARSAPSQSFFWEQKLHLESCGPACGAHWMFCVSEELRVHIHGQLSEMDDPSNSPTHRHCPPVVGIHFPIGSNNRGGHEIPSFPQVVVHEGLHQHLVHIRSFLWPRDRKQVLDQRSK